MPCAECGNVLIVNHEDKDLRCPECLGLDIADPSIIERKIERDRDLLRDENLVSLLEDYSKDHLLLYLIERLNVAALGMYENRRLNHREFSYLNYLIQIIYPVDRSEFGDEYLQRSGDLAEEIDNLLATQAELVNALNHIEDGFRLCLKYIVPMPDGKFLFSDYDIRDTEYRHCFWRNLRSLMGGQPEYVDLFDETDQQIRDFDTPASDEIQTLEDFANTFFEFMLSLLFIASADEIVGDIYTTFLPSTVTVFDIQELLDEIDQQFTDDDDNVVLQDSTLGWTNEDGLDNAGNTVFGDDWDDVKKSIVVSEDSLDAHPFLFKLTVEAVLKRPAGRHPITRERIRVAYPRFYSKLLKYQIFPLLQNEGEDSGHQILTSISTSRGLRFERNVYNYLIEEGYEVYHSAEIPSIDSSEIDVITVDSEGDEIWFIECKYLLPETSMNTADGIENLNAKFDHKVFNIDNGTYEGSPTGQPFPDKVETWLNQNPATVFTWQEGEESKRVEQEIDSEWLGMNPKMMVVSNLVPSYLEKQGVEFLTDMELVQRVNDEEDLYTSKHPMV